MGKRLDSRTVFILFKKIRGKPQSVISDNAPQFKVVKTDIDLQWRKVMLDDKVKQYMIEGGIRWQFTTALAPGFYEKRSLRKAMANS